MLRMRSDLQDVKRDLAALRDRVGTAPGAAPDPNSDEDEP